MRSRTFWAGVVLLLIVVIGLGALIVLLNPGRERPADLTPTPTLRVIVDPTRPVPVPPPSLTPTIARPDPVLLTPHVVPAPSRTPTVEPTPTETPTPKPERTAVQRG